ANLKRNHARPTISRGGTQDKSIGRNHCERDREEGPRSDRGSLGKRPHLLEELRADAGEVSTPHLEEGESELPPVTSCRGACGHRSRDHARHVPMRHARKWRGLWRSIASAGGLVVLLNDTRHHHVLISPWTAAMIPATSEFMPAFVSTLPAATRIG